MLTRESTPSRLPAAGLLRRCMAALYDWLLLLALMMVASVPAVAVLDDAIGAGNPWYRVGLLALMVLYFTGFWVWGGQTPGMRAWRLRVRPVSGEHVSWRQAILRFVLAFAGLLPLAAGFWWMLIDTGRRSWHDRFSGTCIVQEPKLPRGAR